MGPELRDGFVEGVIMESGRRRRLGLAAALVVVFGACSGGHRPVPEGTGSPASATTSTTTTTTTTTTTSTSTTAPSGTTAATSSTTPTPPPGPQNRFNPVGRPRDLGRGTVIGLSADGSAAYVVAENPDSNRTGCEGLPADFLFAVPLDGSPRRLAFAEPLSGRFVRSPDGSRIAVLVDCEEQFDGLFLMRELPGGRLTEVRRVEPETDLRPMPAFGLSWSADGGSLLVLAAKPPHYEETRTVVRLDATTGAVDLVPTERRAIAAAELTDGTLVVLTPDHLRIGSHTIAVRGDALAAAPDGRQLAVYGQNGLTLVRRNERPIRLTSTPVATATWSPDSGAITFTGDAVRVVATGGTTTKVAANPAAGLFVPAFFLPDGSGLVFTRREPGGDPYGAHVVTLLRFPR